MKISLVFLVLLVAGFFVGVLNAQTNACTASCNCPLAGTKKSVDLGKLTKTGSDYTINGDDNGTPYVFHVNFCVNTQSSSTCGKAAPADQFNKGGGCASYLGQLPGYASLMDASNPAPGVNLVYDNGQVGSTQRRTLVKVNCNKNVEASDMTFQGEAVNGTIRTYTFAIDSKYGCVSGGSSGGFCTACFLFRFLPTLFLLLAIVGYIVIGIIVKVVVMKGRGLDIFPNITFWKKVPFLIKEGILLIVLDGIVGGIQKLRRKDYQPK